MEKPAAVDDAITPDCRIIEVHVAELRQLFNSLDPAPFQQRDLDPKAEQYIVSIGAAEPRDAKLALLVYVDRKTLIAEDTVVLQDAIRVFFGAQAAAERRNLKQLFRRGRISLLIGLTFLAAAMLASELLTQVSNPGHILIFLRESVIIGGWVAMWRPLEIFLYDWWPIRAQARLYDRLAAMPVEIRHSGGEF